MKRVLVIMSAYNGKKYIQDQIDSILRQKNVDITLLIRDDGSSDETPQIIRKNATLYKNIIYIIGENAGFRKSFHETLISASDNFDYYAFADQDDVWMEEKLYKAVKALEKVEKPIKLYVTGLKVVNKNLEYMYDNCFKHIHISLGSALSRQRLAGCTMVFSKAVKNLCSKYDMNLYQNVLSHDAVVYYSTLLSGGEVIFNPCGDILYRRHEGTVTEHGLGVVSRIRSVVNIFTSSKGMKYNQAKTLFEVYKKDFSEENLKLISEVLNYRNNMFTTLRLAFNKNMKSGLWQVDLVNKFAILVHYY